MFVKLLHTLHNCYKVYKTNGFIYENHIKKKTDFNVINPIHSLTKVDKFSKNL